jgi:hypothetical protein
MGSAIADSGDLQAPHLPVSARCFAGIRFGFPHDGQFRMMAMAKVLIEAPRQQYFAREAIMTTGTISPALRILKITSWLLTARRELGNKDQFAASGFLPDDGQLGNWA